MTGAEIAMIVKFGLDAANVVLNVVDAAMDTEPAPTLDELHDAIVKAIAERKTDWLARLKREADAAEQAAAEKAFGP